MKIIHTADWHLGQTLCDYDRTPEHRDMLRQIAGIVADTQPDALVVAGDIFDTGNPAPRAVELYNQALLDMHYACPHMQIVVIAGNHDSASRLVVNNSLWDHFKVTIIGSVARNRDQARTPDYPPHIIAVSDSRGEPAGFIAAVPHCYESNFPTTDPSLQRQDRARAYFSGLLEAVAALNPSGLPVVLAAHLAVDGCELAGHDNIGGMETRDPAILGEGYDYAALGHIHSPQHITPRIRYSGTPVPVNFGEKFIHSVSVVTLEPGCPPVVETRAIDNLIPLRDFPDEPRPFSEVLEAVRDYPADELCYLRLLVRHDESMTPLAATLVAEAVRGKSCRVCQIKSVTGKTRHGAGTRRMSMTADELRAKTPLEVAGMLFALRGMELTEKQKEMITLATTRALREKQDRHED